MNGIGAVLRMLGNKKIKPEEYKRIVDIKGEKAKGNIIDAGITNMTVTEVVEK